MSRLYKYLLIEKIETQEDLPNFVQYDRNLRTEAQFFSIDDIRVGDKFFELPEESKIGVILHEIGHKLADELLDSGEIWNWIDNNYHIGEFNGRKVEGLNGKTVPTELVSEAYAVFHHEPEFLKEHYNDLYKVIKPKIEKFNRRLPREIQNWIERNF